MRDLFRNRSQERSFELLETRAMLTTVTWDGEGGDLQWHTAANWDSDVVPGIQDDVIIDIPNSETVINIGANADVLSLQSSEGIKVSSGTLTLRSESSLAALEMAQGTALSPKAAVPRSSSQEQPLPMARMSWPRAAVRSHSPISRAIPQETYEPTAIFALAVKAVISTCHR